MADPAQVYVDPIIAAKDDVGLRLIDAIANSTDLTVEIIFREFG